MSEKQQNNNLICSFCGKHQHDVGKLIIGSETNSANRTYVSICDECVKLCVEMIIEECYEEKPGGNLILRFFSGSLTADELGINPIFSKRNFTAKRDQCFVLCPFKDPFDIIFEDHIKTSIESVGMSVIRADDIFGIGPIIEDIWEQINCSSIIIADITGRNPNVMYEVGIAHTLGKPVILITQCLEDIPFDLRHYRFILYEYNPRGCKELEVKLQKTISTLQRVIVMNDVRRHIRAGAEKILEWLSHHNYDMLL